MKRVAIFTLFILFVASAWYVHDRLNEGFSVHQMTSSLKNEERYRTPLNDVQKGEVEAMLNQPFFYLGKGVQSYVFASQDGRYVIKFFKHKHLRPLHYLRMLPVTKSMHAKLEERIVKRDQRIENFFSSCLLAYNELPEETGILYVHLVKEPFFHKTVTIYDKIGFKHKIKVDEHEFIVQKRAQSVKEVLTELVQKGDLEQAAAKINQLEALVAQRCDRGVRDRDRAFVQNIAFCVGEERAVYIDVGQLYKDATILQGEEKKKDLLRRMGSLKAWTERYLPELTPLVEKKLEQESAISSS